MVLCRVEEGSDHLRIHEVPVKLDAADDNDAACDLKGEMPESHQRA